MFKEIISVVGMQRTKRTKCSAKVKDSLLYWQDGRCNICCRIIVDVYDVDHIIPLHHGGSNERDNLQIICLECHRRKTIKERIRRTSTGEIKLSNGRIVSKYFFWSKKVMQQ